MDEAYRGFTIRVTCADLWNAVLVEAVTGIVMPTKATALQTEGRSVALLRARELIDVYAPVLEQCAEAI